jgi:hypothetical protein
MTAMVTKVKSNDSHLADADIIPTRLFFSLVLSLRQTMAKRRRCTSSASATETRSPSPAPTSQSVQALPMDKRSRFDRRYETATTSPEKVLGKPFT